MRNLTAITHAQRHLNLSPEFGLVQCTAADEEKRILFLGGSGLHIACISANDFEVSLRSSLHVIPPTCPIRCCLQCTDAQKLSPNIQTRWTHDLRLLAEAAGCTIPLDASLAAFAFSVELEVLCIGLSSGHLLLLHHSITSAVPSLEEVGQVEGGVVAAAWSPDGEAVAILGGLGQLLLMTSSWDVLCETPVADNAPDFPQPTAPPEPESEGESCLSPGSASVCWRGDGKYLATCSASAAGQPPRVRIWDRELAQLHALGETAPGLQAVMDWQPNCRHLYVAQRRTLAAESGSQEEGVEDLGPRGAQGQAPEVRHVGAWKRELRRREEAAKAAGTAATPNGVILFERNGLHHGRFDVPCFGDGTIEAMRWSPDSQLLAVVLATGANDAPIGNNGTYNSHADHARVLQLWHRSNWHWYLKHERRFACCDGLSVSWEEGSPGVTGLRAVTAEGLATATSFVWDTCTSALGTVAVVDGNSVLLTPLRLTIVPPPMSAVAVALPAPAVAVALRQHSEDEALAAVLSDGRIAVVECCEDDLWEETLEDQLESTPWDRPGPPRLLPRVLEAVLPADTDANALVRHVTWIGANALLLTTSSEDGDNLIKVDIGSSASGEGAVVKVTPAPGMVVRCVPSAAEPGCIIETEGGNLWKYAFQGDAGEKELELLPDSLPVTCPRVRAPRLPPSAPAETLLGLSADGALFLGNRLVAREVTSFALRDRGPGGAFLLYTTRAQALCTLPLATLLENRPKAFVHRPTAVQEGGKYQPPVPDITLRAIEDNALLVAVPADDVCAIYQAPRGNLELVRPRALVLPAVAAALDAGDYERAWSLATVNRLDLNVLVDYRWPKFLSQAAELLRAVGSDVDVADFLALLNPGSVAAEGGAYANVLSTHAAQSHANAPGDAAELLRGFGVSQSAPELQSAPPEGGNKVAAVCAAVREAIFKGEVPRHQWLRTELTTHSKCGDVAAALLRVKDVKDAAMAAEEAVGAPWSNGNGALQGGEHGAGVGAEQGLKHLLLHSSEEEVYRAALGSYELELAYMVVAHSQVRHSRAK